MTGKDVFLWEGGTWGEIYRKWELSEWGTNDSKDKPEMECQGCPGAKEWSVVSRGHNGE